MIMIKKDPCSPRLQIEARDHDQLTDDHEHKVGDALETSAFGEVNTTSNSINQLACNESATGTEPKTSPVSYVPEKLLGEKREDYEPDLSRYNDQIIAIFKCQDAAKRAKTQFIEA